MKKINISQIDTLFVNGSYPIEFLFFYKHKIDTDAIRNGLKIVSSSFWPLFGIYKDGWIESSKYSEDKFFCELMYNEDFKISHDTMEFWRKYHQINSQSMSGLFFLSVLQFNNGTVIIPKMNHLAGDGYSFFYFLLVLAALSKSSFIPLKKYAIRQLYSPKLNRTVLKSFHFNKTKIKEPDIHKNCTIKFQHVQKTFVKQEIKKIQAENNQTVTANDILSAMIFKRTFENYRSKIDNGFTLSIPIDVRRQVYKIGRKFFGNGLMLHHLKLTSDELDNFDIRTLALKLREILPSVNTEIYTEYLNDLESTINQLSIHTLRPYNPEEGCLVTNLSRMPIQKLDFGSGGPDFVFLLTIGMNSAAILADNDDYKLRLVN